MDRVSVVDESHRAVADAIRPGAFAVDATAGNGGDTAFLCRLVGPSGLVLAVDIQHSAVSITRKRLEEEDLTDRCILLRDDHSSLGEIVRSHVPDDRRAAAVMFNLGYLPQGNKSIRTRPVSTIKALDAALGILADEGVLSIVLYRGHAGASDEVAAVENWVSELDRPRFEVERIGFEGAPEHRPYLILIRKAASR
jgi:predicted methyltransferase